MLKFIFSIGFAWIIGTGFAQKVPKKLLDSLQRKPRVESRIRLGFDLSKTILSLTQSRFRGGEVCIDYNRDRVLFEAHVGFAEHGRSLSTYTPISKGVYYSAGVGKNVFHESDNILLGGLRIAGSNFNYRATNVQITNPYSEFPLNGQVPESQCSAIWAEAICGMRAKVVWWIQMGFEIRVKALLQSKTDGFTPYIVPGYGYYSNKASVGFNYFVYINLPTQKK